MASPLAGESVSSSENARYLVDIIVVGAGISGLYALHKLRSAGFRVAVIEAASGVGGTWYWNRYPGARCDVDATNYNYTFSSEVREGFQWSEKHPPQAEILRYLNYVTDRLDLRKDIRFNTRVETATWEEKTCRWTVTTSAGEALKVQFVIFATGCLSHPYTPSFPGLETFTGKILQTSRWPKENVDLVGKRVAVIGTGSSGVQAIPEIAKQAEHLYVFQRRAHYVLPAQNGPLCAETEKRACTDLSAWRAAMTATPFGMILRPFSSETTPVSPSTPEELEATYEKAWQEGGLVLSFEHPEIMVDPKANESMRNFFSRKIRGIVKDSAVAGLLTPKDPMGCKRPCVGTNYYETYNRPNVTLVDISVSPIEKLSANGLVVDGKEYAVDTIVFATGFDAMTGALLNTDTRGREGQSLNDQWKAGPRTYLGLMTHGFPNLFFVTGPQSPSVSSNMLAAIEQHVDWISRCIDDLRRRNAATIEASSDAEKAWVEGNSAIANATVLGTGCYNWYKGQNVPGKPQVFMSYLGGINAFITICDGVVAKGYEGFLIR